MKATNSFSNFLPAYQKRIENLLQRQLKIHARSCPKRFVRALHQAVLNGGKRLRPLLVYAIGRAYGAGNLHLDAAASAIELIHSFSLVHDDLPAMDNDTLRRGKPTIHIAFDEATAILVGDTLTIMAFQILSEAKDLPFQLRIKMIEVLAQASGANGLAAGQYLDLHPAPNVTKSKLSRMYQLKTGSLISAAIQLGALAGKVQKSELKILEKFAANIGLAFQIQDDLLNIEGKVKKLGKNVGTDRKHNKITYPVSVGKEKAKIKVAALWRDAQKNLKQLKIDTSILHELISYLKQREC